MIAMRSYQKADDLPDPSEVQEATSDADSYDSDSSGHTVIMCDKPTLRQRQRDQETVECMIGRAVKLGW